MVGVAVGSDIDVGFEDFRSEGEAIVGRLVGVALG
jgi:hypothetical protein